MARRWQWASCLLVAGCVADNAAYTAAGSGSSGAEPTPGDAATSGASLTTGGDASAGGSSTTGSDGGDSDESSSTTAVDDWWEPSFPVRALVHYQPLVPEDLHEFPVLLDITLPDIAGDFGPDILIVATDLYGSEAPLEIVHWEPETAHLVAWVNLWVYLHDKDTPLYVYFGGETPSAYPRQAAWPGYEGAWHLDGGFEKATLNSASDVGHFQFTSAEDGVLTAMEDGIVGDAAGFDGYDDDARVPSAELGLPREVSEFTISAWARGDDHAELGAPVFAFSNTYGFGAENDAYVRVGQGDATAQVRTGTEPEEGMLWEAPAMKMWHYYVLTFDGTALRAFVDGQSAGLMKAPGLAELDSDFFHIGSWGAEAWSSDLIPRTWLGPIDEVRLSYGVRGGPWIEAEFVNQSTPDATHDVLYVEWY